ncbi:phosphoribosylanthranilate isomerase [Candidatus Vidania fulgoroideorum]
MKINKKLKICGIKNLKEEKILYNLSIRIIGFIFYCKSFRFLNFFQIKKLFYKFKSINKIIILVKPNSNILYKAKKRFKKIIFQIHSSEKNKIIKNISEKFNFLFIKVFFISQNIYENKEIYNLLKNSYGNILMLERINLRYKGTLLKNNYFFVFKNKKVIISGGISKKYIPILENIYYYDLSSSVEKDGKKNLEKIKIFKKKLKNALQIS